MKKKIYIVRNFDASYFNHLSTTMDEEQFENSLNNEYGSHGFSICATVPMVDKVGKVISYKFIFVGDAEEEDDEQ